jgi:AcrR family transcriptional regulator
MPKIVDHDERRAELAGAVWRIIGKHGIERVTVRNVVDEAGWSRGVLGHYFSDKDHLLLFAFQLAAERTGERFYRLAAENRGLAALRAIMLDVQALDQETRIESSVWLSFLAKAPSEAVFTEEHHRRYAEWRDIVAGIYAQMIEAGEIDPAVDTDYEAEAFYAFADGLAIQTLIDRQRMTQDRVERLIDGYLARFMAANRPAVRSEA